MPGSEDGRFKVQVSGEGLSLQREVDFKTAWPIISDLLRQIENSDDDHPAKPQGGLTTSMHAERPSPAAIPIPAHPPRSETGALEVKPALPEAKPAPSTPHRGLLAAFDEVRRDGRA